MCMYIYIPGKPIYIYIAHFSPLDAMQNRAALGSPSLDRPIMRLPLWLPLSLYHLTTPQRQRKARWSIPFEHTPPPNHQVESLTPSDLIWWPAMLERAVLIMLLLVLLDLSCCSRGPQTQPPPSEAPNIPCLKAFFGGWYPSKQLTWAGFK